ncbi:MAG TPA: HAMP domain-containing sensor histidine kinase [Streptosporangiaceae bacterium]|nr:HAMP domain-containing sensor histidine kinase [Streptosporangiaceae bacterium]
MLAITVIALVAFDFAAVGALRRYLLGHTDAQLATVLGLYRPMTITLGPGTTNWYIRGGQAGADFQRRLPSGVQPQARRPPPGGPRVQQVILGPRLKVPAPILAQFGVGFIGGQGPRAFIHGNPGLVPRVPPGQLLRMLAANHGPRTMISADRNVMLRLGAIREPGGFLYATTSLSDVNSTVDQLELILAIASVAVGLLVAGGIGLVLRRGLRPIERMAGQADKITAGDLTERVRPQDPGTEVGRLGAALNGMLTRIETSVSEREASQELTRRFFADASHELRNPLASLRANAELYQQGALREPHQVDEAMGRIAHEAQRMSALVDDMLRLARLDQQPGQHVEPVDVTALVAECAERAEITDPERAWRTDVAPGLSGTGDAELLRRAVDNLLANVRAHTPGHTTATLTAVQCNGSITIEVSDDGPGVPPDQLARIFDRFYRSSPGRGCPPGSGLGLAIVNAVAAAHNGTAQASLNDPHGLRITLTLPASGPASAEPAVPAPHTVSAPR